MNRKRARDAAPETAGDLMAQVVARLGGQARGVEQRAFTSYGNVVGEVFARRSRPERLRDGVLIVRVESAALAHELVLLRREILTRLTAELGPGVVTDLRTRVGPLEG